MEGNHLKKGMGHISMRISQVAIVPFVGNICQIFVFLW